MLFVEKVELNIELRFGFFPQKLPGPLDMIITLLLISIFSFPAKNTFIKNFTQGTDSPPLPTTGRPGGGGATDLWRRWRWRH
jgi:hypothetical protein